MRNLVRAALMTTAVAFAPVSWAQEMAHTGMASYYKTGKYTASGERYQPMGFTAAHRTLAFGTRVLVRNLKTGQEVIVRVNDRGPFIKARVIDLSYGAALKIGLHKSGVTRVQYTVLR